ncbi:hypothetical protein [Flavobacterium sp.]|uniref:hypothetical protein n=1 Tax=Flavobacterium sp. TaxID=239 RepID=UPI0008D0C926|nr:hypothetical protein [Flavobacterium sp.]OGS65576.1 MAG: hypothetical protein A2X21_06090 [Flavobacteria bacterium GWA2_35_26]HCF03697.1 hypothetical protein [Flavobacterium sp.]
MKKRLEADLISIAHRILQLKNKSDINQLYLETQKLYEKLAVLRFVDEHFGDSKPTIGQAEIEAKIETAFEAIENEEPIAITIEEIEIPEIEANPELILEEEEQVEITELEEPVFEEEEDLETLEDEMEEEVEEEEIEAPFIPAFELEKEEEEEEQIIEEAPKQEAVQISFEDLIGGDFSDDLFVKVESTAFETPKDEKVETVLETVAFDLDEIEIHEEIEESKSVTLNEKLAKGINIDLNDRIAFTKHLFGNDPEDYNRVLNQLITFNTFYETRDFIRDMVKPDYNNWEGKEEYEERFMEIIEKKFL